MTLRGRKPLPEAYPKEINTLGDHLRKRRLDLGYLQREVAVIIGVDESTITNWEKQRTAPEIRFMPKIIQFLGYDPEPAKKSLTEQMRARRIALGLSQEKAAALLGIDPGTLSSWELGRHRPSEKSLEILSRLLAGTTFPLMHVAK